jgi:hypothetical protein
MVERKELAGNAPQQACIAQVEQALNKASGHAYLPHKQPKTEILEKRET